MKASQPGDSNDEANPRLAGNSLPLNQLRRNTGIGRLRSDARFAQSV
jgi:hypothetical protein